MPPQYQGDEAQIGGGFGGMKPLAQHGTVIIDNGVLTLLGTQGQVIASGPLASVELKKIPMTVGQSVSVIIADTKYSVTIGWGANTHAGSILQNGGIVGTRADTQGFVEAFTALSGKSIH